MVMLLFVFLVFPRSRGARCRARGLISCPGYSAPGRLPPHEEGFLDFGLEERKTFSTDFSGSCAPATFEYSSCIFHPTSSPPPLVPVPALLPAVASLPARCRIRLFKGKLHSVAARTCQSRHKGNSRGQVLKDGKEIYRCSQLVRCPTHFCVPLAQELKLFFQVPARAFEPVEHSARLSSWVCRQLPNFGLLWCYLAEHPDVEAQKMESPFTILPSIHNPNN